MKRHLIVTIAFCAFSLFKTSGQDVSLTVDYQSLAAIGDQIKLTYTVNSKDGTFKAPQFDGFYLLMGPATSFSQNYSNINGRMQSQISNSYTYYLQALTKGTYSIKPASYTIKGKTWYSDTVVIKVVESQAEKESVKGSEQGSSAGTGENIYIRLIPGSRSVYVGQALPLALKLYTRQNIDGIGEEVVPPFKGFLKEDVEIPPLQRLDEENIEGTKYGTGIYKRFMLYPQSAGEFSIDPFKLTVLVRQQRSNLAEQFFADPFSNDFWPGLSQVPVVIASLPVTINVKPLPLPSPADFAGAVGDLKIERVLSASKAKVNEAITFTVKLMGEANFRLAGEPRISFPAGVEAYDPKVSMKLENRPSGPSGEKVFEYLLIPRNPGKFVIPAITYSYFDPSQAKYISLSVPETSFEVAGVADDSSGAAITFGSPIKNEVRYLGSDIRYIKEKQESRPVAKKLLIDSTLFLAIYPIVLLVALVLFIALSRSRKKRGDIRLQKRRKAYRKATKKLKRAGKLIDSDDKKVLYDELLIIIWGYLSDRLGIPLSRLNRVNAFEEMEKRGVPGDIMKGISEAIETIEFSRYASSDAGADPVRLISEVGLFIKRIEETI